MMVWGLNHHLDVNPVRFHQRATCLHVPRDVDELLRMGGSFAAELQLLLMGAIYGVQVGSIL
jgi:hypothetical protein